MNAKKIVEKLKPYQPERVILFGSWARGRQTKNSDIDIAIIKKTKLPFWKRNREVRLLCQGDTPMDIFIFTPEEFEKVSRVNPFVAEIKEKGKVIYEQEVR